MGYVYLAIAIVAEVIATSALKSSNNFTRPVPSAIVIACYALAFYSLSFVLRTVPVAYAYALWSGIGIALVTIVAAYLHRQTPDAAGICGLSLIGLGIVVLQVFSRVAVER